MGLIIQIVIGLVFFVPWVLNNRVLLLLWFVLVTTFLIIVTNWAILTAGDAPAALGYFMMLAMLLFVVTFLFCTIKGLMIYKSKDGTIKALPLHFFKGTLGVLGVIIVMLTVVALGLWMIMAFIS